MHVGLWDSCAFGLHLGFISLFFLITQGLHTLNNKTLVAVLNKRINREI